MLKIRRIVLLAAIVLAASFQIGVRMGWLHTPAQSPAKAAPGTSANPTVTLVQPDQGEVARAYAAHASRVEVQGGGVVEKVLRDDTQGSRHQRFILRVDSGQSVLFAHNIELASRVPDLHEGERVEFMGEYEWNDKGGVVHWTHHDPSGQHPAGWLKVAGVVYR
jgi:hypothetical protein